MALYINGRPVNPIVSLLVSAVVAAGVIALGILLLPVIGGIILFILLCLAGIALYAAWWRWRNGDPFKRMQQELNRMREGGGAGGAGGFPGAEAGTRSPAGGRNQVRTGVRRTTVVEDVTVVEEIPRRES